MHKSRNTVEIVCKLLYEEPPLYSFVLYCTASTLQSVNVTAFLPGLKMLQG